jgi:tetratricopeptide (TPR) repeat protein
MECSECGQVNPDDRDLCQSCGHPLSDDSEKTGLRPKAEPRASTDGESPTEFKRSPTPRPRGRTPHPSGSTGELSAYQSFGERFEILELLGEGGMGRVYKAWDRELEKVVALKTIRGEQAENPDALKRFKQELLLARQITHKNVIRIHDMGEAEGVKFFTMEFIVGESLKELVRRKGRLPVPRAVSIARQILGALEEAHSQGVIHRDLKPQNIMIDPEGGARVMDFGIARSVQDTGMTATGMLMGTPDYMSPEQARGQKASAPSDVFSFGVMLYEMVTGALPYSGDTSASRVMARLTEKPQPIRDHVLDLPRFLESVILKCLEVDLSLRYKSVREIVDDLEREQVDRSRIARGKKALSRHKAGFAAAIVTVAAVASAIYFAVSRSPRGGSSIPAPVMTLAIVPFGNATNDRSLDWMGASLAEILTTEVGQSDRLRTVTSDRVSQILSDLRFEPGSRIDSAMLARVAEFSKADTVVSGQYLKLGGQIRIDATVQDLAGNRNVTLKAEAPSEAALIETIRSLAGDIRGNLGLSRDVVAELESGSLRPSSDSLQALGFYREGEQLLTQAKPVEALKRFEAAVGEDREFALAYAVLGQTYASLGYDFEAEQSLATATELGAGLPQQERSWIAATQARIHKDYDKAIQSYGNLATAAPESSELQFRLAELHEVKGEYDRAQELYEKVLALDPGSPSTLLALGSLECKRGRPQRAFESLTQAQSLATQGGNEEARGSALFALGIAYRDLGRNDEAQQHFQDALEIQTRVGDKRATAESLKELAKLDWAAGRAEEARASYQRALELHGEIGDRLGSARVLLGLGDIYKRRGQYDEALDVFKASLRTLRELGDKRLESVCLNLIGGTYVDKGDYGDGQTHLELALRVREELGDKALISETVHNLGELALQTGRYDRAIDHYLRALELSRDGGDELGAAIESHSLGRVFGFQGRLGASAQAAEDAVASLEKAGESGFWRAAVLSGRGNALNRVGRFDEGSRSLDEALRLARELEAPMLVAQALNSIAEAHFYRGSPEKSRAVLEEALRVASEQNDETLVVPARVNLARLEAGQSAAPAVIEKLRGLAEEAEALGLEYYAVDCSIAMAEVLLRAQRYPEARETLEKAIREAARSGLRVHIARIRYLLGETFRLEGSEAESRHHYREAARTLEEISQEAGAQDVLTRADLGPLFRESTARSASASSR